MNTDSKALGLDFFHQAFNIGGKKHLALIEARNSSVGVKSLLQPKPKINSEASSTSKLQSFSSSVLQVSKNSVLDAEIRWAANCVANHYSYNSCNGISSLFRDMFPDSEIAKQFMCGPTKCAYLICFGLAPFFNNQLIDIVNNCENFVILFDESLNKTLQSKQMDIHIRFWNKNSNMVNTRYWTSVFLGHSTANDIFESFQKAVAKLQLSKMLQLSMDGPAVNWKVFDLIQAEQKTEFNSELLNVGSCTLHTINNCFKRGCKAAGWHLDSLLSSLYWLFKDSPARREDFLNFSSVKKVPFKFCSHRWLENIPAAERAIELWDDLKGYVRNVEKGNFTKPMCKSFSTIQEACKDKLILVKLNAFLSIAKILTPFLTVYQSDKPLLPFMAEDLRKIICNIILNFNILKKEDCDLLNSSLKVSKLDFDNKEMQSNISKVSVGFAGDRILKTMKFKEEISDKDVFDIKTQCKAFVLGLLKKLIEKSPIRSATVRCLVALDPRHMALSSGDCYMKMKHLLAQLVKVKLVNEAICEPTLMEYNVFLLDVVKMKIDEFESFNPCDANSRLDTFLKVYCDKKEYCNLWNILKMLLILSHGQADVERGFSFNRKIEIENLKAESLVAQRKILDYLRFNELVIDKELRASVASARQRYVQFLEEQKSAKQQESSALKRKSALEELNKLQCKKIRLESAIKDLENNADELALKAENCSSINYITQSNSFRKSAKEKKCELEKLETEIKNKTADVKELQ